jgi:predicted membrane metal-binding protein
MKGPLKLPTDRSFGFTFAVVFALFGGWLLWKASTAAIYVLGASAAFAVLAVAVPKILHPLNVVWMRFGALLNLIVTPIVMGVIYFGIFTPVALVFRIKGRDALRRSFERDGATYWIDRTPPGPDGQTLPRQF